MALFICSLLDEDFEAHVLHHLHRLEFMMTQFADDQAHLDADVTALSGVLDELAAEIATLKSQPPEALNFTNADTLVAKAQGLVPPPVAHVPPADTLYQHVGGNPIDPTLWVQSTTTAADGSPLYTYTGTSPFDTSEWVAYVAPVAAPAATDVPADPPATT